MVPRDPTGMWTFARKGQHTIPLFYSTEFHKIIFAIIKYLMRPIARTIVNS
jgi:hypothetical protein